MDVISGVAGQARLGACNTGFGPLFVTTCMLDECQHQHYTQHMPLIQTHLFQMRVSQSFLKKVDDWRRMQPDLPARAEAIRRLVDKALSGTAAKAPPAPVAKARAAPADDVPPKSKVEQIARLRRGS